MRTLGGILLLVAFALQLILGAVYIMASRYETPAGVSPKSSEQGVSAGRQLGLGAAVLAGGLAQLLAAVLMLRRRTGRLVLALVGGAVVLQVGAQLTDGPITVGLIALGLTVVALAFLVLAGRRVSASETSA